MASPCTHPCGAQALRYAAALCLVAAARGCVIAGVDAGQCISESEFAAVAPFCASVVRYAACVPAPQRGFAVPTAAEKDAWVAAAVANMSGSPAVETLFEKSSDCGSSYRAFACYLAFPRCDDGGASLLVCTSACENYFRACKYPTDMYRCYNPVFYGGQYEEGTQHDQIVDSSVRAALVLCRGGGGHRRQRMGGMTLQCSHATTPTGTNIHTSRFQGNPIYTRAMYPGLPFAPSNGDLDVCTPGITGAAAAARIAGTAVAAAALVSVLTTVARVG